MENRSQRKSGKEKKYKPDCQYEDSKIDVKNERFYIQWKAIGDNKG